MGEVLSAEVSWVPLCTQFSRFSCKCTRRDFSDCVPPWRRLNQVTDRHRPPMWLFLLQLVTVPVCHDDMWTQSLELKVIPAVLLWLIEKPFLNFIYDSLKTRSSGLWVFFWVSREQNDRSPSSPAWSKMINVRFTSSSYTFLINWRLQKQVYQHTGNISAPYKLTLKRCQPSTEHCHFSFGVVSQNSSQIAILSPTLVCRTPFLNIIVLL